MPHFGGIKDNIFKMTIGTEISRYGLEMYGQMPNNLA
jgi:hypothetical protein